jgi:hypothetical protein
MSQLLHPGTNHGNPVLRNILVVNSEQIRFMGFDLAIWRFLRVTVSFLKRKNSEQLNSYGF